MYAHFFKRLFDLIFSGCCLILLSPVIGITALLVRIKLGSPVIFHQERPGLNEKIFTLKKFRTMTDEKDENGELLPDSVRLTKFGELLRRSSLDELPELWNIFTGEMSLIGPRPLLTGYLPYYTEKERLRHSVRPGLTGLAQVNGRNFLPWDDRLALDVTYAENITFIGDIKIFFKTIMVVFKKDGAAAETDSVEGYLWDEREKLR